MTTTQQTQAGGAPAAAILPEDSGSVKGMRFARWFVWFVWAYFTFVVVVLTMSFFLLLFNADPDAGFVAWVYRSADRAMEPFRGIFPTETAGNGSVIDFSILFAMIVYGIVASLVSALVSFLDRKIAEERSKAMYIAQEEQRRREYAMTTNAEYAAAQYQAQQDEAAARLASRQVAAQQRTAEAAEHLATDQLEPPSPPQT
jgi:uncharacterized protein YggT (Ycf19 family)